jgi:hypothetical protein
MSSLTEFLVARISADEAAARDAVDRQAQFWIDIPPGWVSPARMLAECAAKRAIIELAADAGEASGCTECNEADYLGANILRRLAAPYSSHPDFDSAWGSDV